MNEVRDAVVRAGVLTEGHFVFVDGEHSLVKVEMDKLWEHEEELAIVLRALADARGLQKPDVILGVPRGGQLLVQALFHRGLTTITIAHIERVPGGEKRDFRFCTEADKKLAQSAKNILIYEEVVSILSSIAGGVKMLYPDKKRIE